MTLAASSTATDFDDIDDATLDAMDSMVMNAMDYFECPEDMLEICAVVDGEAVRMFCRRKPH